MTTKIEWATDSWNPITGCTPISEGCAHCYAKRMATRLAGRYGYPKDDPFKVTFHPDRLEQPMKWKKPRMIFVVSMGDLFHEDVTDHQIHTVLHRAELAPQHTYLFLTKRPNRMRSMLRHWQYSKVRFPNWWLGVTAENQQRYDERWTIASQIPAAIRFVSMEPLLGDIDFSRHERKPDWIIAGGETGTGARPAHPDWFRSARDQCQVAGAAFFFKHWGKWAPREPPALKDQHPNHKGMWVFNGGTSTLFEKPCDDAVWMNPVGKKAAGRLLDGREWNEYSEAS